MSNLKYVPVERTIGEYGRCALYVHNCGQSEWILDIQRDEIKGGCDACESGSDRLEDWTPVFKAVPVDENTAPEFPLKAKDLFTIPTILFYKEQCEKFGAYDQAQEVERALTEMIFWRDEHKHLMKLPDHPHVGVWIKDQTVDTTPDPMLQRVTDEPL